ncbi:phage baseplate assembly protein [Pseudomonas sp. D47]|uniref:phage baseplate assembly protein n=1 Tax=Pseudomonas sp. D47 TaxID=3159447 RepID=UPI00387AAD18
MSEANNPGRAELTLGRQRFEGWTSVSVTHSIESAASNFDLSLTDRWGVTQQPRPVRPGSVCALSLEGQPLINGYIDAARPGYDAQKRSLSVSGRAKTCDLVDCSLPMEGGQFKGQSLVQLAKTFCAPFGIEVVNTVAEANNPVGSGWQLEPGETGFESLERAARFARCLLTCDPSGRLVITRASTDVLPIHLRHGEQILEASADYDHRDRFSEYIVKGDTTSGGDDWDTQDGEAATQSSGRATDDGVSRYRPMVLIGEDNLDNSKAALRADWEMRRRRARSQVVEVTVQGWTMPGSHQLWPINKQIRITDPWLGLDSVLLLITAGTFTKNSDGTRTRLSLMPREGFEVDPIVPKTAKTKKAKEDDWS